VAWLVEVRRRWPALVGPVLAAVSRPERRRGDALVVVVTQPAAAQELRWRQAAILRALPASARAPRPTRVRVVVRSHLPAVRPGVAGRPRGRRGGEG
jgi:predicted nucleic acid-binding Zn ribbon protein